MNYNKSFMLHVIVVIILVDRDTLSSSWIKSFWLTISGQLFTFDMIESDVVFTCTEALNQTGCVTSCIVPLVLLTVFTVYQDGKPQSAQCSSSHVIRLCQVNLVMGLKECSPVCFFTVKVFINNFYADWAINPIRITSNQAAVVVTIFKTGSCPMGMFARTQTIWRKI